MRINLVFALLFGCMVVLSTASSVIFLAMHGGIPSVNKAPIKLIIFIFLAGGIISEVARRRDFDTVWCGFVYGAIVGAMIRLLIIANYTVKDPGIYTFTGIFVSATMLNLAFHRNARGGYRTVNVLFWSTIFLLHLSASRTELALFCFTVALLLYDLSFRSIPLIFVGGAIILAIIPIIPEEYKFTYCLNLNSFRL